MTTHQLAKILLEKEDIPVVVPTHSDCLYGFDEVMENFLDEKEVMKTPSYFCSCHGEYHSTLETTGSIKVLSIG